VNSATVVVATLLCLAAPFAKAFEAQESVRVSAWSSSRKLDDEKGLIPLQVWLRSSVALPLGNARVSLHGEAWVERQLNGTSDHSDGRVKEAYAQLSAGPLEVRGGWQIFAWGRADAINPTDNLTPRQLTFLTRDTEDQRFGSPALSATWFSDRLSVTLIWLAGFESTELPLPAVGPILEDVKPAGSTRQWAARLERVLGTIEGSISYFDGYDILPTQVIFAHTVTPRAWVLHERLRVLGGDVAKTVGRFGLRAEAAYLEPPEARRGAIFTKRPQGYVVAGGDRTFGEYFNVNLQYYYRYVDGAAVPPGITGTEQSVGNAFAVTAQQYDRIDQGITFKISDQWRNETLEASLSGLFSLTRRGYLVRPVIKYRATDAWTVSVGGEILTGDDRSLYGFLHDNTTIYAELRWGF
jgi:hypothetical protein